MCLVTHESMRCCTLLHSTHYCLRFYGPALSDAFPDATVWVVPGLLEGKGLPVPFLGQMTATMRPRCKALGELGGEAARAAQAAVPRQLACSSLSASALPAVFRVHLQPATRPGGADMLPPSPIPHPGVDPLPAELQGQVESELLTAPFFIEAAVVLPQHGALLLADTGGWCAG